MGFTNLHVHSMYSTLDGFGTVDAICERAKAIGSTAVAITDHTSISNLTDFMKAAKAHDIKPIVGCEFYWVDDPTDKPKKERRFHLTAWAKNWNGVLAIMRQLTVANEQFHYRPRLSWRQCLDFGPDVMVGTACGLGVLSRHDYVTKVTDLIKTYGVDNVYIEIMPHDMEDQKQVNQRALEIHTAVPRVQVIATNDSHYVTRDDAYTHEVMLAIQTKSTWNDPKRWRFDTDTLYLRTDEEMYTGFRALGSLPSEFVNEAIATTQSVADKVDIVMPKFDVNLPSPYEGDDAVQKAKFMTLVIDGWKEKESRFDSRFTISDYGERLKYEVEVINRLGFVRYFLVVDDIIRTARSKGIKVGPGRGSAAGSLVCWLLGITQVDPLRFGLFFERFLNPERIDLPDIDVDFQDSRRDEVFEYIRTKYGAEYTASINTYGCLSVKSAFRDVCRVFEVNNMQVNILSKQIEDMESFETSPDLVNFAKHNKNIMDLTQRLDGVIRTLGQHACGIIVSNKKLSDVAVIERREGGECINWDKRQAEDFGLVKIDILGLATLTVLDHAQKLVKERRGIDVEFTDIPLDDLETMQAFCRGEGIGVFQFENQGMIGLLRSLNASDFDTITNTTALFRPGSLHSGQTDMYVKIHKGDEYESYPCEQLRPILGSTKSVMVYQEQIMQIFNQLAGFTWAQADKMRKIIGKKLGKDEFEKHRKGFVDGCQANGIAEPIASSLFDKMAEFAAYSFNKSHAIAYTTISVWSMYFKVHYPEEFFAALLSHTGETDRLPVYAKEAARLGIEVLPPDVNLSDTAYKIVDEHKLIAPLGAVKGVGTKAVEEILRARNEGEVKAFLSYEDFVARVQSRTVNIRVQELLKRAGGFASLGYAEEDPEQRSKDYAELLPFHNSLPTITKNPFQIDVVEAEELFKKVQVCASANKKTAIAPKLFSKNTTVMVINAPVKGELEHFKSDGSKFLLDTFKELGIDKKIFYYTSPVKCAHNKQTDVSKECLGRCMEYLREEITMVKPKLIVCFTSNIMKMLGASEDSMAKHHGKVVYNKEFNCYVMFSYSPQYAYFQDTKTAEFKAAMENLKEILS